MAPLKSGCATPFAPSCVRARRRKTAEFCACISKRSSSVSRRRLHARRVLRPPPEKRALNLNSVQLSALRSRVLYCKVGEDKAGKLLGFKEPWYDTKFSTSLKCLIRVALLRYVSENFIPCIVFLRFQLKSARDAWIFFPEGYEIPRAPAPRGRDAPAPRRSTRQ